MMINSHRYPALSHQAILPDLSSDEQTLFMSVIGSPAFTKLSDSATLTPSSIALAIAVFSRPNRISHYSFRELLQVSESLNLISEQPEYQVEHQLCQQRRQQVLQEIQSRKLRFERLRNRLNASVQRIKSLNVQLYDRVFAPVNFERLLERVLDGDETSIQQELVSYQQMIHEFYEELTLRQLAPIACQKRRLIQKTRRLELFYEYLPVFSLATTTILLSFWLTWTWSLIAAMFIVGPMMIWFAYPRRCALRTWSKQTLATQDSSIAQGRYDLTTQEAQVLNLLLVNVERTA